MDGTAPRAGGTGILARLAAVPAEVVVVRALRLGDLLCAVPALRSLRAALPYARITLIGLPLAAEFVRRCAYVDQPVDPRRTVEFLAHWQAEGIDLAIQMHGSGVFSNPFTRLLGARYTVGFTREGETDLGLDFAIPYPSSGRELHRLLALTRALGAPDLGDYTELTVLESDRHDLRANAALCGLLDDGRPLAGLHPGAKVPTRRWMPERFAAVGDWLAGTYAAAVIITGGADEWESCERVRSLMRAPAHNVAGQTHLGSLAALLERLTLFVTNDSGPAHLAAALGTPSVTIFGAAQVEDWAAVDTARHRALSIPVPCRPCYLAECPIGYRCLAGIGVDDVKREIEALIDPAPARGRAMQPDHTRKNEEVVR